jgi:dihydrofolate reductase
MAMSLNGMIASKNGNEDFLSDANWKSFGELAKKHGCFIIGRKTYEAAQKWLDYNFNDIEARLKIVVSNDKNLKLDVPFSGANSPKDAIEKAIAMNFESAILTGGSTINSAFITENLIDEVMINIEPAIVGSGIPLFAESEFEKRLSLIESVRIANDILQVRYKVNKK